MLALKDVSTDKKLLSTLFLVASYLNPLAYFATRKYLRATKINTMKNEKDAAAKTSNWGTLGTIIGPIFFTLSWMILGPLRSGYSSVSQPISALAIGPDGIFMRSAFLLAGLLITVGIIASSKSFFGEIKPSSSWVATILLLLPPIGLFWDGIFTMDNLTLHTLGAQIACGPQLITLPIVGLILRRLPKWRRLGTWMAILSGPLMLISTIGFMTSVPLSQMATGGEHYGLWQRACTISAYGWYVAIGCVAYTAKNRN